MNGGEMGPFRGSQLQRGGGVSWDQASHCPQADFSSIWSIHLEAPGPHSARAPSCWRLQRHLSHEV